MSSYNISTNHPLIPNSNNYMFEQKYISIHSNDRDIIKFPRSSEFEIELPQDYLNVVSARLHSWAFPSNYSVFSIQNYNTAMTFKFEKNYLYNPSEHTFTNASYQLAAETIYACLLYNIDKNYVILIEQGFYNPEQMATELTNKMNEVVNNTILQFFNTPEGSSYIGNKSLMFKSDDTPTEYAYNRFVIVYNIVNQKIWFGNNADKFTLTNDTLEKASLTTYNSNCLRRNYLPDTADWGLPSNLGFGRCPSTAITTEEAYQLGLIYNPPFIADNLIYGPYPRFYYGPVNNEMDNGYWLVPNETATPGSTVYYIQAPYKINLMGPAYIYMEIEGLNYLDETVPYNVSNFTRTTNQTNGIVNSSFAKIALYSVPLSQYYDKISETYKYFAPPAERIRRLKIKLRYHDGEPVDFGVFDYSFTIEFNLLRPQNLRSQTIQNAFDLSQMQSR
jgi:hypothetical protein